METGGLFRRSAGENMVFVELKRRGGEIYYWRDLQQREVDFVVKKGLNAGNWSMSVWILKTRKPMRETSSLLAAMKDFRLKSWLVITEDFEGEEKTGGKKIVYAPLWKWLLGVEGFRKNNKALCTQPLHAIP